MKKKRSTSKLKPIHKTTRKEKSHGTGVKVKRIEIPNFSCKYKISIKINGDLSHFKIPGFLSSVLSMPRIPIGSVNISASRLTSGSYDFFIDLIPSPILSILTKHEKFSYRSLISFDEAKGFITNETYFLERKTDGREFRRTENFSPEEDGELNKDPIALFLDLVSSEDIRKQITDDINPFDIKKSGDSIFVYPKKLDYGEFFSSVEIALQKITENFKIPKLFHVRGLFSIFDIFAESE